MYLERLEKASANQRIQFDRIFTPRASDLDLETCDQNHKNDACLSLASYLTKAK